MDKWSVYTVTSNDAQTVLYARRSSANPVGESKLDKRRTKRD